MSATSVLQLKTKLLQFRAGYARRNDELLIHGSSASRMMRNLSNGVDVCVTVTCLTVWFWRVRRFIIQSIIARSLFSEKRSLSKITAKKTEALKAFTQHIIPHRWDETSEPNELELKATTVLRLPITEASAKIRTGDSVDDEEVHELNVRAGVIPLKLAAEKPADDKKLKSGNLIPDYVLNYTRG